MKRSRGDEKILFETPSHLQWPNLCFDLCSVKWLTLLSGVIFSASLLHGQTMVNSWTFSGGGLDPASYGGNFRPSNFVSDSGSTGTAVLSISGLTSGGLGSSTLGSYGGLYTFFSTNVTLGLQVTGILAGIDEITLRLVAGGGSPALTYSQNSLTLNYNLDHPGLVASTLATVANIKVPSPDWRAGPDLLHVEME